MRVLVSILTLMAAVLVSPAAAADGAPAPEDGPVAGFAVVEGYGPGGDPFAGERVFLQSPPQWVGGGGRADWTCTVDVGAGPQSGYWRSKPHDVTAPCTLSHVFASPGTVTVTMVVTDPQGRSVTTTRDLEVTERPVDRVDAGEEGSRVPLPAAASGGVWVVDGEPNGVRDRCELEQPDGNAAGSLRCFDDGRFRLHLNAADGAESRGIDVSYANGAPDPRRGQALVYDSATFDYVPGDRLYAGDALLLQMQHGDPGTPPRGSTLDGDQVQCSGDLGDGTLRTEEAYYDICSTQHAYQRPGSYRIDAVATDDVGASGSRSWWLDIGYRPVSLDASGPLSDGSTVTAGGSLERTGPVGAIDIETADGRVVRQSGPVFFEVIDEEVRLRAPATVDGLEGYSMQVAVSRVDGSVMVTVWSRTENVLSASGTGGIASVGEPADGAGKATKGKGKDKARDKTGGKNKKGKSGKAAPGAGKGRGR